MLNVIIKELNKKQQVIKANRVKTDEIEKPQYEYYRGVNIDDFVRNRESEIIKKIPIGSELISSEDILDFILQKRIDNNKKELERKKLDDHYWFANDKGPNAKIYDLDTNPVCVKNWYELENMKIYYDFFKSYKDKFEII